MPSAICKVAENSGCPELQCNCDRFQSITRRWPLPRHNGAVRDCELSDGSSAACPGNDADEGAPGELVNLNSYPAEARVELEFLEVGQLMKSGKQINADE